MLNCGGLSRGSSPLHAPNKEKNMVTIEDFTRMVETPLKWQDSKNKVFVKTIIARTVRLALTYPNLAREYFDSIPKATMDIVETSKNE